MPDAVTRLSRAELLARLRQLPGMLSGRIPDPTGLVPALMRDLGREAFACIHEAYLVKSRGGIDAAGVAWPPRKDQVLGYGLGSGNIVAVQGRIAWRAISPARRVAPGRYLRLGDRPIGIKTRRLIASYEPGATGPDQIMDVRGGSVTGGSNVPYAAHFAAVRPIVPAEWPEAWRARLLEKLGGGLPGVLLAMSGG